MQVQLLKDIIKDFAGATAVGVVDLLHDKKNVNEFLIAKKLGLTINQTRNILYRLADEGLVSFVRKKDSRKGGWYTYFWTLSSGKSLSKFKDKLLKNLENLNGQLQSRLTKTFYYCKNCDIEYNEENALLHEYTCPECGEILGVRELEAVTKGLQQEIARINKVLEEVNKEIEEVNKKEDRGRARRFKEEEKKKEKEKLLRKRKRDREKKKLDKDTKKKKNKKKSSGKKGKKKTAVKKG